MKRLTGNNDFLLSCRRVWQQYVPKIIAQAKQERGTRITHMVSECLNDDQGIFYLTSNIWAALMHNSALTDEGNGVIALCLLPYLIPDSRAKPDYERIVLFSKVQ